MTQVIYQNELEASDIGHEFQGFLHDNTNVSFIIISAAPGTGPQLHSHPYEEILIIQEGQVTCTIGDATVEATAGQILIVPPNVPHKFVNSGTGILRQVDIHASPRFITTWL